MDWKNWWKPKPKPQTLGDPWRMIPPKETNEWLKEINRFKPKRGDVKHINILLYGLAGAGKSSFINSVETALTKQITSQALSDGIGHNSFTTECSTYKIPRDDSETYYPFVFTDMMGLESETDVIMLDDIKLAMKGHVKDGYKFDQQNLLQINDPLYRAYPSVNDKTHVLVCVVSGSTISLLSESVEKKMRKIRLAARDLGIPEITILTKIDEACKEVFSDIKNVYKSQEIKKQVEKLHAVLGTSHNCIFPVKNYSSEIYSNPDMDKLILMALKQMIDFGEQFVNRQLLDEPWRKPDLKINLLQSAKRFQLMKKDVQCIRILLYGPSQAGKSSFINSVESTLRGRITFQALADGHDSFTTKYLTYKIPSNETFYPFVFNEVMSLDKDANRGVCLDDIKLAMKGHVKEDHVFNPQHPLGTDDKKYQANPTMNDQIHVLVCVVPATTVIQTADFIDKMKDVQSAARILGIPQSAILIKIDEACSEVQSGIGNVYRSKLVSDKIDELSRSLRIPQNCIFPVKNYCSEMSTEDQIDAMLLMALMQMIHVGEDYVNKNCNGKTVDL